MKKKMVTITKYVILALAVFSIAVGVIRKEPRVVMKKATNICLECIGIG